jgi:preprotein translocase subunit SecE
MTAVETTQSRFDAVKTMLAIAIVVAGIYAFYGYAEQYILLYRVLALLAVIAVAVVIMYQTLWGKNLWSYLLDARTELRKVVWPTRAETTQTTLIVIVVVVVTGIFLWGADLFFGWLIQWLLAL